MDRKGYRYERYRGRESEVCLPETVDGLPLTVIGMKAFLSCKSVERLVLPSALEAVEDWGFAHMKKLREIVLPAREIAFGKKVFLGCDSLQRVLLKDASELYDGIPYFLATAFYFFGEETLQSLQTTGLVDGELLSKYPDNILQNLRIAGDREGQWHWLYVYDRALEAFLKSGDDDDFVPAFIGWFDVEDVEDQRNGHVQKRREEKVRLVFRRLLYPEALEAGMEDFLNRYLRENADSVAELFLRSKELGGDIRYYKIWRASGGLSGEYAEKLMEAMEEEPEILSFLLECRLDGQDGGSFFEGLEL